MSQFAGTVKHGDKERFVHPKIVLHVRRSQVQAPPLAVSLYL